MRIVLAFLLSLVFVTVNATELPVSGDCRSVLDVYAALPDLGADKSQLTDKIRSDVKGGKFQDDFDLAGVNDLLDILDNHHGFSILAETHIGLYALAAEMGKNGLENRTQKEIFYFFALVWRKFGAAMTYADYAEKLGMAAFRSLDSMEPLVAQFASDLKALGVDLNQEQKDQLLLNIDRLRKKQSHVKVDLAMDRLWAGAPPTLAVTSSGLNLGLEFLGDTFNFAYRLRRLDHASADVANDFRGHADVNGRRRQYASRTEAIELLKVSLQQIFR